MQVGGKPGELRQVEMGGRQLGSEGPRGADELSDACPDRAQGEQVLGLVRPIAGVVELVIDDVEAFGDRAGQMRSYWIRLVTSGSTARISCSRKELRLLSASTSRTPASSRGPTAFGCQMIGPSLSVSTRFPPGVNTVILWPRCTKSSGASGFILLTTCRRTGVFLTDPVTVVNTPRSSARSSRCHGVKPPVIRPIMSSIEYRKWMLHSASRWRIP